MCKKAVEDHQIAGLHRHRVDLEAIHVGPKAVASFRLPLLPLLEGAKELRNTLEATCLPVYVNQRKNALNIHGKRIERRVDVGMDKSCEGATALVWRVQVGAIYRHPKLLIVPDVYKRIVKPLLLAVIPKRLMVVNLDHTAVVQFLHGVIAHLRRIPC